MRACLAALLALGLLLGAAPLAAQPAGGAAADTAVLDEEWTTRLERATERVAMARDAVAEAQAALGKSRHRKYPRGDAREALERDLDAAREELAAAEEELPALLEEARRAGVSPAVLLRFEPEEPGDA